MADRPTGFIDVDETLVKTRILAPDEGVKPGYTLIEVQLGKQLVRAGTKARPSARVFLEALQAHCNLSVLTTGGSEFQSAVLEAVGLRSFFNAIYGRDNAQTLTAISRAWVLVDDLPCWASGLETKMEWLGKRARDLKSPDRVRREDGTFFEGERWQAVLDRHYVNCQLYFGEEDDSPLSLLTDQVIGKLVAQSEPGA